MATRSSTVSSGRFNLGRTAGPPLRPSPPKKRMNIRILLLRILVLVGLVSNALEVQASPIASYWRVYASFTQGATDWEFHYGIREENSSPFSLDVTLLSISSFSNAVWGSTYIMNAENTASFAAFTAQLTDGEQDWIGAQVANNVGGGSSGSSPEPSSELSLAGYAISSIEMKFEEDHTFDPFFPSQVQGKYTVTFFGSQANVPDPGSVGAFTLFGLLALAIAPRRFRTAT